MIDFENVEGHRPYFKVKHICNRLANVNAVVPLSGCNLICKNLPLLAKYNQSEPRRMSEKCQSLSCIHCWHTPSLTRVLGSAPRPHRLSACSYLVRYVHAQIINNGGEQTTTEPINARPMPTSKRRNIGYCFIIYLYFIVYFDTLFYLMSTSIIYSIYIFILSLVSIHAVFLFLLCMEHWNKNNFPPGINKVF